MVRKQVSHDLGHSADFFYVPAALPRNETWGFLKPLRIPATFCVHENTFIFIEV